VNNWKNNDQSFPLQRDFKTLTAAFHDEATERAVWCDLSSDKLKYDMGIFSIVYPNLHQKENFTIQN
jgi:hypothetical protein